MRFYWPTAAGLMGLGMMLGMPALGQGSRGGAEQPGLTAADFSTLKADETIGLFLLVGQSNMKGRGLIDLEPVVDPRVKFFHLGERKWFVAREPLHALGTPDNLVGNDNSGTGPGTSFAYSVIGKSGDALIGLIPAAEGGVPIRRYAPGEQFYLRSLEMVAQAKELAPPKSELRAILWLQGESDAQNAEQIAAYEAQLLDLIDRYRRDLGDPELPFIACTIGSFIADGARAKRFPFSESINEILLGLPEKREHTACIDARDITGHVGDALHYNADAQLEIGRRFAKTYLELIKK